MFRQNRLLAVCALFALAGPAVAFAAEEAPDKPAEPETYTVEPGFFKVVVSLTGVFETGHMLPLSRAPKGWTQQKVLWAAKPGAAVKKGDVLVRLDTKGLDKRLRDIASGQALALLKIKQASEELRLLEITTPDSVKQARLADERAREDLDHYMKATYAFKKPYQELDEIGTDLWLKSVRIELSELKKMYEADDLVEATEKLVLARQEHNVKRTEISWKKAQLDHAWKKKVTVPRELDQQQKKVRDAKIALAKAETMLEIALERKRLEIAQMKYNQAEAARSLQDLEADRATMTIRSPGDGTVYYGECDHGYWTTGGRAADMLKTGGQLAPHAVFMTIVQPKDLFARAYVFEKDLHDLRLGMTGKVVPVGYPKLKLTGRVKSIKIVPSGPSTYSGAVALDGKTGPLLPGMTCSISLLAYKNEKALAVPAPAVFAEPEDEERRYVFVQDAEGKAVKQAVSVGRQSGDKLEILDGLHEGSVILLKKPGK